MKDTAFPVNKIPSYEAYRRYLAEMQSEYAGRKSFEKSLVQSDAAFTVDGYCYICRQAVKFHVDYFASCQIEGMVMPNWRERLICPLCRLNNRMRASLHLFEQLLRPHREKSIIYIAEQTTPIFLWLVRNYANVTGSEYFGGDVPAGTSRFGIRNEDMTGLSFADRCFDFVLSFDVFEHIPNFLKAFGECSRVLNPGGSLFFTVPFNTGAEKNIVRAIVKEDHEIEHLLPPEIHGSPTHPDKGCLAFYHFGWEMLDQLRETGFADANAYLYWSDRYGYLGGDQIIFVAQT